jgi:hypothetical protein
MKKKQSYKKHNSETKNMSSADANKSWDEQRSSQMVSRFCFLKKLVNVKSILTKGMNIECVFIKADTEVEKK